MTRLIAMLAAAGLAAAPVQAGLRDAAFASSGDQAQSRSGIFVGGHYNVGLDRTANRPRGQASLKLSGMRFTPETGLRSFGQGAELRLGAAGRPTMLVGGQEIGQIKQRANLSGGTVALAALGVLVIGGAIAYFALRDPCDHKECE